MSKRTYENLFMIAFFLLGLAISTLAVTGQIIASALVLVVGGCVMSWLKVRYYQKYTK